MFVFLHTLGKPSRLAGYNKFLQLPLIKLIAPNMQNEMFNNKAMGICITAIWLSFPFGYKNIISSIRLPPNFSGCVDYSRPFKRFSDYEPNFQSHLVRFGAVLFPCDLEELIQKADGAESMPLKLMESDWTHVILWTQKIDIEGENGQMQFVF